MNTVNLYFLMMLHLSGNEAADQLAKKGAKGIQIKEELTFHEKKTHKRELLRVRVQQSYVKNKYF